MSFQVHVLHEALPAALTQKASLLVVEADVRVQCLFLGETLSTETAGECPLACVNLQVRPQVASLVEGLPTEAAGVGFLSGVDPQVHLQRRLSREALPAYIAGVSDLAVGAQVSREAVSRLVLVSTESTAAVWVLQVSLHMFHQEAPLVKGIPAHFAAVVWCRAAASLRLVSVIPPMRHHMSLQVALLAELLTAGAAGVHLFLPTVLLHVSL